MGVAFLLSACAYQAPRYGISASNIDALKTAAASSRKVSFAPFTSAEPGLSSIMCRAVGPVEPPDGMSFDKYIQEAMTSEFRMAGLYAADAPVQLQGRIDDITFNSNIFAGKWTIDMTFSAPSIEPFKVAVVYPFSTNFGGGVACNQVATALPSAVQDLIGQVAAHPSFKSLTRVQATAATPPQRPDL